MTHIYLVRHGESVANTKGIYQGQGYDTPLSPLGNKQAQALARRFADIPVDRIVVSPLLRTKETAGYVSRVCGAPMVFEHAIIETNHGAWEGKSKDEIIKTWPVLYKKWLKFPSGVKFPGGEHFLETQKRVIAWWVGFLNETDENILVVTHDNIIRIIVAYIFGMKLNKIWKFHLQPTAVTHVVAGEKPAIIALNDGIHLGTLTVNLANHAL